MAARARIELRACSVSGAPQNCRPAHADEDSMGPRQERPGVDNTGCMCQE